MSPQRSVVARLTVSLFGNAIRSAVAVVSGLVVARALGPADYGGFVFLLATLTVMRQLLDMGSSTAFYTFTSQRPRGKRFFAFYAAWQLIQIAILLALVAVLLPDRAVSLIWLGHERSAVLLASAATLLQQQVWTVVTQIGESRRQTRQVQVAGIYIALSHLLAVWGLAHFGWMTQTRLFVLLAVEYAVATPLLLLWIGNPADPDAAEKDWRGIAGEFWRYCRPLVLNAWVGVAYGFADNWLLQRFGGATEQGYFAVSSQLSAVTLLATTSLLQIFWKEIAECCHRDDLVRARRFFDRSVRLLLLIGASTFGILLPWSKEIIEQILGQHYSASWMVFGVMLAFPIHTALGQIVVAVYAATGRTRMQALIFNAGMIASIFFAYFTLATPESGHFGLGLGSKGLAIRLVIIQVIQVNFLWWWLCKSIGWEYEWRLQILIPSTCILLGTITTLIMRSTSSIEGGAIWISLLASLVMYVLVLVQIVWRWPSIIGMNKIELRELSRRLVPWLP